jgi:hypothetical protein
MSDSSSEINKRAIQETGEPLAKVLIWRQQGSAMGGFASFCEKAQRRATCEAFFSISDGLLPNRLFSVQ